MKFIDLHLQQQRIKTSLDRRIQNVLAHGQYINGQEVRELEQVLAEYAGTRHAVGCASGTDALLMSLMALGIGPGDAVFTTPFTFIATAEVISLLGAAPVFVDVDPGTFNIDPVRLEQAIKAVMTKDPALHPLPRLNGRADLSPKGVIAVDLFGLSADYDRINAVARENGLFAIEDAAQSFGGEYKGRKCCSLSDIACTSFFPAKPLGCYGDGGMCFTDDDALARTLRSIRVHGMGENKYDNVLIGINGRLDTIQAAILLAKFEIFQEEIQLRNQVAKRYTVALESRAGGISLELQHVAPGAVSAWAQYSLVAENDACRTRIQEFLAKAKVPTAVYYPRPLHLQKAFSGLGYGIGDFPVSEKLADGIFSIPMHPYLAEQDQESIMELICRSFDN